MTSIFEQGDAMQYWPFKREIVPWLLWINLTVPVSLHYEHGLFCGSG